MTESEHIPDESEAINSVPGETMGTYSAMFGDYLDSSAWAKKPEHMLFVFHVRKLCERLDGGGIENAAMSGAYLNAIKQLELRRPGARQPTDAAGDGGTGSQTSIFDHMEE